jgi:hypothetical protein
MRAGMTGKGQEGEMGFRPFTAVEQEKLFDRRRHSSDHVMCILRSAL